MVTTAELETISEFGLKRFPILSDSSRRSRNCCAQFIFGHRRFAPLLESMLTPNQMDFFHFVRNLYVATSVEELDADTLPDLIKLKYETLLGGFEVLDEAANAHGKFIDFQKYLYRAS